MNLQNIFQHSKTYKDISERRNINFSEIIRALQIVKKFIIKQKRILYGGMAIDLNLKISGHAGIYRDDAIPDYDFMSPDFYNDSNKLAVKLHKAGFKNVSSINAVHISTRRVRINFIEIADITYIPSNIYENLPVLTVDNMLTIHPDFQRMDMHRAFSIPLEKPPQEVFTFRTKKDQHRFHLLDKQYPILAESLDNPASVILKLPIKFIKNNVLGGFMAYAFLYNSISELMNDSRIKAAITNDIKQKYNTIISATYLNTKEYIKCEITIPDKHKNDIMLNIITDDFTNLLSKFPKQKPEYYNKYVDDWRPRTILLKNDTILVEIFDNKGKLLPVFEFNNINISTPQYVMLYFLQKYFETKQSWYKSFYVSTKYIVELAELLIIQIKFMIDASVIQKGEKIKLTIDQFLNFYKSMPFFLTANTYGKYNWSADYIDNIIQNTYNIYNTPAENRIITRPTFGFYPESTIIWNDFNPQDSVFFEFDGKIRNNPFKPLSLNIEDIK